MPATATATAAAADPVEAGQLRVRHPMAELLVAFVAGVLFAVGLTLSGMTQPDKIIGFLSIRDLFVGVFPGQWDASLAFVMGGAVVIALLGFSVTPYASVRPWFTSKFMLPTRERVDGRLIAGAVVFGLGWGLSGYCPGPALASLLTGQIDVAIFVLAMLPGMYLARKI